MSLHMYDIFHVVHTNQVHVLGVSETFFKPEMASKLVNLPGYNLFRVDRIERERGGVAMYVHESISAKEIFRSSQGGAGNFRPEILFIELSLGQSKILCGTVYNAPDAAHWSDVDEALLNCKNPYDFTIIMGDFNINWLKPSATLKILRDFLLSFNLDHVPFDTTHHRDRNNSHTAIDYICV